ncbi:Protein csh3 [Candidozyma auris]|uniref:Shr3 amino acid permease chaperone n=2 Tax=Candidozyma auris TaxID=498019 RepID=A0ABF7SXR4_CANAR|nr:hypothetical_protein [[Candida] auris]KND98430.1 hypothetical protein QG37_04784 [[Candida] auris]PIS51987.1 hypothetical protein B9J08_003598 [[Candida] auris]PIS53973.1 hypothetical protein CJI97_003671 [[Candida] auris]QEO21287.1 hypothetical_protein [[Candida] auris]QWW21695.1 hypothetical protein CA7LBN_000441 [[Candida] auris]
MAKQDSNFLNMAYSDLVPVGTALIIAATSFGLGVIYGNSPYDFYTLWRYEPEGFTRSLAHYSNWANAPMRIHHILHFVMFLGLSGCFIKLYKPHDDVKYFEYGTLGLMMVGIVIYLTNLRIGVNSCVTGQWGEVDQNTGLNVMAASQFMIVIALSGVLILQGGLYYAQWYDAKIKREFLAKEAAESKETEGKESKSKEVKSKSEESQDAAKSTGVQTRSKAKAKGKKRTA